MALPNRPGDSEGSIEKFAHCKWAGAKVCYSLFIPDYSSTERRGKQNQTLRGQVNKDKLLPVTLACRILFVHREA